MPPTPELHQDFAPVDETCAFWTIFLLVFGLLFVAAAMVKLLGLPWRGLLPGAQNSPGLVSGVQVAVRTIMARIV